MALATSTGETRAMNSEPSCASSGSPTAREENGGTISAAPAASGTGDAPAMADSATAVPQDTAGDATAVDSGNGNDDGIGSGSGDGGGEEARAAGTAEVDSADDVADAIARATAGFAMPDAAKPTSTATATATKAKAVQEADKPKPRATGGGGGGGGKSDVAATGRDSGEKKTSGIGRARAGGVSSSLMRGTASSASRLKLNVPSALDEDKVSGLARSGSAPRSSSRRPSTGELGLVGVDRIG